MKQTRRSFLQQSAVTAGSSWLGTLAAISDAAAATSDDYRALVCFS